MTEHPRYPFPDEAYELPPYEFKLFAHYFRACPENGGMCRETVRETGEAARMSASEVTETRKWLEAHGWIVVSPYTGNQPRAVWIAEQYRPPGSDLFAQRTTTDEETSLVRSANNEVDPVSEDFAPGETGIDEKGVNRSLSEQPDTPLVRSANNDADPQPAPDAVSEAEIAPNRGRRSPSEQPPLSKDSTDSLQTPTERRAAAKKHPAVEAYRFETHLYPQKNWIEEVIAMVGDAEQAVKDWQLTVHSWTGKGWSKVNVAGMLQRFRAGDYECEQFGTKPTASRNGAGPHPDKGDEEDAELAERQRAYIAERMKQRANRSQD